MLNEFVCTRATRRALNRAALWYAAVNPITWLCALPVFVLVGIVAWVNRDEPDSVAFVVVVLSAIFASYAAVAYVFGVRLGSGRSRSLLDEFDYAGPGTRLESSYDGSTLSVRGPVVRFAVPLAEVRRVVVHGDGVVFGFGWRRRRFVLPRALVPAELL